MRETGRLNINKLRWKGLQGLKADGNSGQLAFLLNASKGKGKRRGGFRNEAEKEDDEDDEKKG